MKNTILFLILIIGLFSCKKAQERSCFKGKGDIVTTEVALDNDIDSLVLHDDIYYTLIPGKESKVVLTGGENLLPFIDFHSENGKLTVRNKNKCKFLRSLKNKIYASIYVDSITFIEYYGSRGLHNEDTLRSGELRLVITDGAGEVNLTLNNGYTSAVITYGVGNFILNGQASIGYLRCSKNSYCDTRNFKTLQKLIVNSNTQADMIVNANNTHLTADIGQKGNIIYTGSPTEKSVTYNGQGKLIHLGN